MILNYKSLIVLKNCVKNNCEKPNCCCVKNNQWFL